MRKLARPTELIELTNVRRSYSGTPSAKEAWSAFGESGDRTRVREKLKITQNNLCAYCENTLDNNGHIDHFKPKSLGWKLTFDWDNLVVSCTYHDSCGHKKDNSFEPYWINPYLTDPLNMFKFYTDGQIKGNTIDAENIIKDFGLDCPRLETKRRGVLSMLKNAILDLAEQQEALESFLQEEFKIFPTASRQIVNKLLV